MINEFECGDAKGYILYPASRIRKRQRMIHFLIVIAASTLLLAVLYFEHRENRMALVPTKSALSSLFILAVLVQAHPVKIYYHLLLTGLILCLIGDVCLAFKGKRAFLVGLISFLSGHVFYVFAFFYAAETGPLTSWATLVFAVASGGVFYWLRPHLGPMIVPVLIYVLVITLMVSGAFTILGDPGLLLPGRIMVFTGALSFYFSDVFVARDRFVKKEFKNRLAGLPMYYAGQFLLAFSVGQMTLTS